MPQLVKYLLSTGRIAGVWESNTTALLDGQRDDTDPTYGYLLLTESVPTQELESTWYVLDGVLTAKTTLVLSADPAPFAADGVTVCTVSVSPFVPCTLRVNGTPLDVSAGDEVVTLTADVPETFTVTLAPMAAYQAAPLTIEAV
jgi:hypothetical protein